MCEDERCKQSLDLGHQTKAVADGIHLFTYLFILMQFEGAYRLIDDWKKASTPTTGMYNVILAGYFREVA